MKKLMIACALLLALCVLLISCGEGGDPTTEPTETTTAPATTAEMTPEELWETIDARMEALDSYTMDLEAQIEFSLGEDTIRMALGSRTSIMGLQSGDFYFLEEDFTSFADPETGETESLRGLQAYHEGRYFISSEESGEQIQKLCSPMTVAEAIEFRSEDSTELETLFRGTDLSVSRDEDGDWILRESGYTAMAIQQIKEEFGLSDIGLDLEVLDVILTVTTDESFLAKQITLEFSFASSAYSPLLTMAIEFSEYDSVAKDPSKLTVSEYTEIEDLRLLDEWEKELEGFLEKSSGSFVLEIRQEMSVGTESMEALERDSIAFGVGEQGYYYDVSADVNGVHYEVSYLRGLQAVTANGQSQSTMQSEAEAKGYIAVLFNNVAYSAAQVSDVEALGNGVYELYGRFYQKETIETVLGGPCTSFAQKMQITVSDGRIASIVLTIEAAGMQNGTPCRYDLKISVTIPE